MDKEFKKAKSLIPLIHDGTLTDEQLRFIEETARRYPELKREIYRYERLHDIFGAVGTVRAPRSIEHNVVAAIQSERPIRRIVRSIFLPARRIPIEALGAAGAAVVVLFLALTYGPSLLNTYRETMTLSDLEERMSPAASAPTSAPGLSGPLGAGKMPVGEDIALAPSRTDDQSREGIVSKRTEAEPPEGLLFETSSFSAKPSPSGAMTACGVVLEKASTFVTPTRSVLLKGGKSEESPGSTILIYSSMERDTAPGILLIHDTDPLKAQREIVEKALSLGGTAEPKDMDRIDEKGKADTYEASIRDRFESEEINIPPGRIDEFFDYLLTRYPETAGEIERLGADRADTLLRIDIVPPVQ